MELSNVIAVRVNKTVYRDGDTVIKLFGELAPEFTFVKRLENLKEFASQDEERSLKNLLFMRSK